MNISILSHYYLDKNHKKRLDELGNITYLQNPISVSQAMSVLKEADIALINLSVVSINEPLLSQCHNLKYISLSSIGYEKLDISLVKKYKVLVSNNPAYCSNAVAEHTFALLLSLLHRLTASDNSMRIHPYRMSEPHKYADLANMNVFGKTLGIIGFGDIGKKVARIGQGFGMKIITHSRSKVTHKNVYQVSLQELLKESDVVSLHLPLTNDTRHFIGEPQLKLMKPHSVLICTTRGDHVDNFALANAIKSNHIYGAGLDVLENYSENNPLLDLGERIVLTPHSAWLSKESLNDWAEGIIGNIEAFIDGKPRNLLF